MLEIIPDIIPVKCEYIGTVLFNVYPKKCKLTNKDKSILIFLFIR